jgi:hypothetical protein
VNAAMNLRVPYNAGKFLSHFASKERHDDVWAHRHELHLSQFLLFSATPTSEVPQRQLEGRMSAIKSVWHGRQCDLFDGTA